MLYVWLSPNEADESVHAQAKPRGREFVSQDTCKLCHNQSKHGKQWKTWRDSPHARAYETLFSDASLAIAKEKGMEEAPHEAAACLRCHVTEVDPATKLPPKVLAIRDGVQCESCHGPGERHVADGRARWMDGDREVDTAARILRPNERTCVRCHRRQSPTWDPERYALPDGRTTGFDFQQAFAKIAHRLLEGFVE